MGHKAKGEYFRAIHALPSEIYDSASERSSSWAAGSPSEPRAATRAELQPPNPVHSDGGLGGRWLSLVGAAESAVTDLDALGAQAVSGEPGDRTAVAVD